MSRIKAVVTASTLVLFATTGLAGAQQRAAEPSPRASGLTQPKKTPAVSEHQSPAQGTISAPTKPQRDPGGGAQGRQALADAKLPDLLLTDAFQLGNATIAWGSAATVSAADASTAKSGVCSFNYKYPTGNQGGGESGATTNRIHRDTQNGPVLASNALPALAPDATSVADGHVLLKPGTWTLYVHADDPQGVAESNETNNLRRVKVTVEGTCG